MDYLVVVVSICCANLVAGSTTWPRSIFGILRVVDVIKVMALTTLIGSFENIGIVAFQKNMEFGRDFQFLFYRRIAGFLVTIALALWLHSYCAMVIGSIVGRSVGVVVGYWLHNYRPQFSMARVRILWSFSQWVFVRNFGNYGVIELDKLLLGHRNVQQLWTHMH